MPWQAAPELILNLSWLISKHEESQGILEFDQLQEFQPPIRQVL